MSAVLVVETVTPHYYDPSRTASNYISIRLRKLKRPPSCPCQSINIPNCAAPKICTQTEPYTCVCASQYIKCQLSEQIASATLWMHKYFNRFGCAACCQFQEQGKVLRKLFANSKDKSQEHAMKALLLHTHAHVRRQTFLNPTRPTSPRQGGQQVEVEFIACVCA